MVAGYAPYRCLSFMLTPVTALATLTVFLPFFLKTWREWAQNLSNFLWSTIFLLYLHYHVKHRKHSINSYYKKGEYSSTVQNRDTDMGHITQMEQRVCGYQWSWAWEQAEERRKWRQTFQEVERPGVNGVLELPHLSWLRQDDNCTHLFLTPHSVISCW